MSHLSMIEEHCMARGMDLNGDMFVRHPDDTPDNCNVALCEGMAIHRMNGEPFSDFIWRLSGIANRRLVWFLMP